MPPKPPEEIDITPTATPPSDANLPAVSQSQAPAVPAVRIGGRKLDLPGLEKALDWAYGKALDGLPGFQGADSLVTEYTQRGEKRRRKAERGAAGGDDAFRGATPRHLAEELIRKQALLCAGGGFVTGLGGLITLPVALPGDLTATLLVQLRMVAAVASLAGLDPRDPRVKSVAMACLLGSSAVGVLQEAGVRVGTRVATQALAAMQARMVASLNQRIGMRLLTKLGERGVASLGRLVPLLGGVVCGGLNLASTQIVGKAALRLFFGKEPRDTGADAGTDIPADTP